MMLVDRECGFPAAGVLVYARRLAARSSEWSGGGVMKTTLVFPDGSALSYGVGPRVGGFGDVAFCVARWDVPDADLPWAPPERRPACAAELIAEGREITPGQLAASASYYRQLAAALRQQRQQGYNPLPHLPGHRQLTEAEGAALERHWLDRLAV